MKSLNTYRKAWHLAERNIIEQSGVPYICYALDDARTLDDLPYEFFSHQFMEVNPSSNDDVLDLAANFGIMEHPGRLGKALIGGCESFGGVSADYYSYLEFGTTKFAKLYTPITDGFDVDADDIDALHTALFEAIGLSYNILYKDEIEFVGTTFMEMRLAIADLQCAIAQLFEFLRGERDDWPLAYLVNSGASNPSYIALEKSPFETMSLTSAICNQIIDTIEDEHPWKQCQCDGCDRMFKKFQGRIKPKTDKNPSDAIYCCKACQDRQGQRNRRERLKLMK